MQAQQPKGKLPPLDAIRVGNNAAWTVRYTYPAGNQDEPAGSGPPRLTTLIAQRKGNAWMETRIYHNGRKEERLVLDRIQFRTADSGIERLLPSDSEASDYSETDFPELRWAFGQSPRLVDVDGGRFLLIEIDSADRIYTRKEQKQMDEFEQFTKAFGKLLEMDKKPEKEPFRVDSTLAQAGGEKLRLFLHPITKLPVRFESPDGIRSYSFQLNPPAIQIPEQFRKVYLEWHNDIAASVRPASQP